MDNIVGYICSTPWGTVSRTTPSLGWTPVLPAIPDVGKHCFSVPSQTQ